jgi:hypothetical protein
MFIANDPLAGLSLAMAIAPTSNRQGRSRGSPRLAILLRLRIPPEVNRQTLGEVPCFRD